MRAGKKFRIWRETDLGRSRPWVAGKLWDEFLKIPEPIRRSSTQLNNMTYKKILVMLSEFENSRYKSFAWFGILIVKTFPKSNLQFYEFMDETRQ